MTPPQVRREWLTMLYEGDRPTSPTDTLGGAGKEGSTVWRATYGVADTPVGLGWTSITELHLNGPDVGTDAAACTRAAARELRELESHRRLARVLRDQLSTDLLEVIKDPTDTLRASEAAVVAATAYEVAVEVGRPNPVDVVCALLGCSVRTARRRLETARERGLLTIEAARCTKTTKRRPR